MFLLPEGFTQKHINWQTGMFKNNEAFHFMASHAHVCLDLKDQAQLKNV